MQKTKFQIYLENISNNKNFIHVPQFFNTRVICALNELSPSKLIQRPISAPRYLNDLGVRISSSPYLAYKRITDKFKLPTFNINKLQLDIAKIGINKIGIYLDAFILVIGDYKNSYPVIVKYKQQFNNISNYRNCISIASFFAAMEDDEAVNLFIHAYNISKSSDNKIVALHRKIAYLIKKTNDTDTCLSDLCNLLELINSLDKKNSKLIYLALANNLVGLYSRTIFS